jgi:hypothetical protein
MYKRREIISRPVYKEFIKRLFWEIKIVKWDLSIKLENKFIIKLGKKLEEFIIWR